MATLNISTKDALGAAVATKVVVRLVDSSFNPVTGYASGDVLVREVVERTASDGTLALDLTPNASISPSNTFYGVWIDAKRFLVEKTGATQTLLEALAASPADLASVLRSNQLADVASTEADDDEVLVSTSGVWTPGQVPTGGLADDAVTTAKIAAGAVDTTELADDAVETAKIAAGAVTATELGSDAVQTAKIADSNVTTAKIASEAVTPAKVNYGVEKTKHGRPRTEAMRGLEVALGNVDNSPAKIVVVGDSVSQDWRAVDAPNNFPSWVRLFEEDMAERFADGRLGVGWVPIEATAVSNAYGFDTHNGTPVTEGLGGWAVDLANGEQATHTCSFDAVEVFFMAGAGSIEVRIDSVLVDTIDTSSDASPWVSSDLGAVQSRELELTSVGATRPYGAYFHAATLTSGVQLHNGGHFGWGPTDHLDIDGTTQHITDVQPDAVIVLIGHGSNGGYPEGLNTYTAQITALLDACATAAPNAAVIHVAEYCIGDRFPTWPNFVEASRELALDGGYGFVDLFEVIGSVGSTEDPYSLDIGDHIHLKEQGMRIIADTMLDRIVGPVARQTVVRDHGGLTGLGDDDHTIYALADASRGDFVPLATPAGDGTVVTMPSGDTFQIGELFTRALLGLRKTGDTQNQITLFNGNIYLGPGGATAPDLSVSRSATGVAKIGDSLGAAGSGGITNIGKGVTFVESADPAAPAANNVILFAKDNGSGKTQLCARFATGAVQVIATQP